MSYSDRCAKARSGISEYTLSVSAYKLVYTCVYVASFAAWKGNGNRRKRTATRSIQTRGLHSNMELQFSFSIWFTIYTLKTFNRLATLFL